MDELQCPSDVTPGIFKQLIKVRAAERKLKAEERRLKDLIRIDPGRKDDGLKPLDIFPELVWERILDLLKPKDLHQMSSTCRYFQAFLEPRRIQDILLPQVLELEAFKKHFSPRRKKDSSLQAIVPYHDLRAVCRSFNCAVDLIHEQAIDLQDSGGWKALDITDLLPNERIYLQWNGPQAVKSIERINDWSSNLKMTRAIVLQLSPLDDGTLETLSTALVSLLNSVGKRVLSFAVFLVGTYEDPPSGCQSLNYDLLHSWLSRMPNLKNLVLDFEWKKYFPIDEDKPFPHLKQLELLRIRYEDRYGDSKEDQGHQISSYLEAILSSNMHLKQLILETGSYHWFQILSERTSFLQLLESLDLQKLKMRDDGIFGIEELKSLLRSVPQTLKKIEIDMYLKDGSWYDLLGLIGRFHQLEHVILSVSFRWEAWTASRRCLLHLPSLRTFEFQGPMRENDLACVNVDFLILCGRLEQLTLHHHVAEYTCQYASWKGTELVGFRKGVAYLDSSNNIWKIFPSLKQVKVGTRGYPLHIINIPFNPDAQLVKVHKRPETELHLSQTRKFPGRDRKRAGI